MLIIPETSLYEYIFYNANHIAFIFPVLVILTGPIRYLKDIVWPSCDPQALIIINSKSYLNVLVASHSFEIYLVLFIVLWYLKLRSIKNNQIDLSTSQQQQISYPLRNFLKIKSKTNSLINSFYSSTTLPVSDSSVTTSIVKIQFFKLLILYSALTLLLITTFITNPSLFELIQSKTGGYCSNETLVYYRQCLINGDKFIGGFKTSGHCLLTSTFASFLLWEWVNWRYWCNSKYISDTIMNSLIAFFLSCWLILFSITCLFYHTFLERVFGTLIGSLIFSFCYSYLSL